MGISAILYGILAAIFVLAVLMVFGFWRPRRWLAALALTFGGFVVGSQAAEFLKPPNLLAWAIVSALSTPPQTVRYQLDITMDVDGEVQVFSGVYELELLVSAGSQLQGFILAGGLYGEAIPIVVDSREAVFALMTGIVAAPVPTRTVIAQACGIEVRNYNDREALRDFINEVVSFRGPCELPAPAGPLFGVFSDPEDPESFVPVPAASLPSALEHHTMRLISVVVRNTREPATYGRLDQPSWLYTNWAGRYEVDLHYYDGTSTRTVRYTPIIFVRSR